MHSGPYIYHHNEQQLHGYLAYHNATSERRPTVLIAHDWTGQNAFARQKADELAHLGYVGFALDIYGEGKTGTTKEEKQALMSPFIANRRFLQERMQASLEAVKGLPMVDPDHIVIAGFCFGGLCALDLARTGTKIQGAVSFHGLLNAPETTTSSIINSNILVLHGYDDPMVRPDDVDAFCQEMTKAKANWQLHTYGQTQHAFMVPEAHDVSLGTIYQPQTANRAWQVFLNFLTEVFQTS